MSLLIAGLVLFTAVHLIPSVPPLRAVLVERLGAMSYRGVFSAVVLLLSRTLIDHEFPGLFRATGG